MEQQFISHYSFPEAEAASRYNTLTKREMLEILYERASDVFLETFDQYPMTRGNMVQGFKTNRDRLQRMLVALNDESKAAVYLHPHYHFVEGGLSIHALPGDALFAIFFQLEDFEQFAYLAQVCSDWNRLLKQSNCWENYLRDIFACFAAKTFRALQSCGIQPVPYRAFFYKQLQQWGREIDSQHSNKLIRQLCGAIESNNVREVRDLLQRGARADDTIAWNADTSHYGIYYHTNIQSPMYSCLKTLRGKLSVCDAKSEGDRERQVAILELLVRFGARLSSNASYYRVFMDHSNDIKKLVCLRTWLHLTEVELRPPVPFTERGWMYWQNWRRRGLAPIFTLNVWTVFPRPPQEKKPENINSNSNPSDRKRKKPKQSNHGSDSSSFSTATSTEPKY